MKGGEKAVRGGGENGIKKIRGNRKDYKEHGERKDEEEKEGGGGGGRRRRGRRRN